MKLSRSLTLAAIGLTSFAALTAAQGCSSSSSAPVTETKDSGTEKDTGTNTTTDGGGKKDTGTTTTDAGGKKDTGSTGGDHTDAGRPPQPTGPATTSMTKHNFAVHNLYVGDSKADAPTFTADTTAWSTFGYNIDGLITTAKSTDVCTPYEGMTQAQVDGVNGIDNAFGAILVPTLMGFSSTISSSGLSMDIAEGKFTLMFDTVGLTNTQPQNATKLGGSIFAGSTYTATSGTPALTGSSFSITDDWPVNGSLLVDPSDITMGSKIVFGDSYITNGTWVSGQQTGGSAQSIVLALSIMGYSLNLTINDPVITMPVSADASGQFHAKDGQISGVIAYSQLSSSLNVILAGLGDCSLASAVAPVLEGAQDILIADDGTVSNTAGTACNGISIGLGFDADEIAQPDTVAPVAEAGAGGAKSCTDGG